MPAMFMVPTTGLSPGTYEVRLLLDQTKLVNCAGNVLGQVQIEGDPSKGVRTTAEVRDHAGTPMLHVNGQPVFTSIYYCAYNTDRLFNFFAKDFSTAGYDYFILNISKALG